VEGEEFLNKEKCARKDLNKETARICERRRVYFRSVILGATQKDRISHEMIIQ
jgi:hypothetical protein